MTKHMVPFTYGRNSDIKKLWRKCAKHICHSLAHCLHHLLSETQNAFKQKVWQLHQCTSSDYKILLCAAFQQQVKHALVCLSMHFLHEWIHTSCWQFCIRSIWLAKQQRESCTWFGARLTKRSMNSGWTFFTYSSSISLRLFNYKVKKTTSQYNSLSKFRKPYTIYTCGNKEIFWKNRIRNDICHHYRKEYEP
jgi:hypothetical protein